MSGLRSIREALEAAKAKYLLEPGNIDLNNRQVVLNDDGSFSTEESMSFGDDNGEILVPTVVDGTHVSPDAAIQHFYDSGEHLGRFSDPAAAEVYAEVLHNAQERRYRAVAEALMAMTRR